MKPWVFVFVFVSLCMLVGCQQKLSSQEDLKVEVSTNEQPQDSERFNQITPIEEIKQNRPVVVTVTDPQTLEIITTITPKKLGFESDMELYQSKIKKIAKDLAKGTATTVGYDQTMTLDKIETNGEIIKGNPGQILKESELVEQIMAASKMGGNVDLPLYVIESNYSTDDIPSLDDVVVASFTTYFKASDAGRSKNIELSAMALNNMIVGIGDYFSFNTMVGERTVDKGYQPALEIINKELVMGIGGGICQTSSTLFNAVDQTDIRIVERHHHSLDIGYVPIGRDATVSYGSLDFKFQNTSGVPFIIKSIYHQGVLTIEIRTAPYYQAFLI